MPSQLFGYATVLLTSILTHCNIISTRRKQSFLLYYVIIVMFSYSNIITITDILITIILLLYFGDEKRGHRSQFFYLQNWRITKIFISSVDCNVWDKVYHSPVDKKYQIRSPPNERLDPSLSFSKIFMNISIVLSISISLISLIIYEASGRLYINFLIEIWW